MMSIPFCNFFFAASLALAPADRLQMADKMFAKGLYQVLQDNGARLFDLKR